MAEIHNIIHCDNVTMQYDTLPLMRQSDIGQSHAEPSENIWTLGPLSLCIHRGEKVAVIGKSGSGKTSFLSLLQYASPNISKAIPKSVSYTGVLNINNTNIMSIFQEPMSVLSPLKTVYTSFKHLSYSKKYPHSAPLSKKEVSRYLNIVGLEHGDEVMKKRPYQLSGGMAQKVMIAMVLAMEAEVLLADEITSSLDRESEKRIIDFLFAQFETMIIVTHKLYLITERFQRIIFFEEGKILFDGTRVDFLQSLHPSIQLYRENLMLLDTQHKGCVDE